MEANETLAAAVTAVVVVDLTISTYSGRKKDKKTQAEVTEAKSSASRKAASVYKSLFAECRELEAINKYQGVVRATHYRLTKPWTDFGSRILPIALMNPYVDAMNAHEATFQDLVNKFLDKYEELVTAAAFQLGDLFDRAEYPPRSVVASKFRIVRDLSPMPMGGDWRLDLEETKQKQLIEDYQARMHRQLAVAQQDNWNKIYSTLRHMSTKLTDREDPESGEKKPQKLYATMIEGANELCELLKALNITNDPSMERARCMLADAINGVEIKDLKKSEGQRVLVKQKIDAALSAFDWGDADGDAYEGEEGALAV